MNATSNFTPFQFPVQVTIDGRTLDYLLTVDETGQVFEAVPTVFDLPMSAQKLILGETDGQLERKIWAYAGLFKYLVPLALAKKIPNYQEELAPLVVEIENRLQKRGKSWARLPLDSIPDSIPRQVLTAFGHEALVLPNLSDCWEKIVIILTEKNRLKYNEINAIGRQNTEIAVDFFSAIAPFLGGKDQQAVFECLQFERAPSVKEFLVKALNDTYAKPFAVPILIALANFPKEKLIHEAVVTYCGQNDSLSDNELENIIAVCSKYPTLRSREICFEILCLNRKTSSLQAAKALRTMGVGEKEIVAALMPYFDGADLGVSEAIFSVFKHCISFWNLPTGMKVLNVYVNLVAKHSGFKPNEDLTTVAIKSSVYSQLDQLMALLEDANPNVREGILVLLIEHFKMRFIDFKSLMEPPIVEKYLDLINDPDPKVAPKAICLLGLLGAKQRNTDYITILLDLANQNLDKDLIIREVIRAINEIIDYTPYQYQIEPFYLAILEGNDVDAKRLVFTGLRFSPDKTFKMALHEQYRSDPEMRGSAHYLITTPYRGMRLRILDLVNKLKRNLNSKEA